MRHRPIADPTRALARAVDPTSQPTRERTLEDILAEAGITPDQATEIRLACRDDAVQRAAEMLRHVVLSLGRTKEAKVLELAILGGDGRSLADHAIEAGVSRQRVHVSARAIQNRICETIDNRP